MAKRLMIAIAFSAAGLLTALPAHAAVKISPLGLFDGSRKAVEARPANAQGSHGSAMPSVSYCGTLASLVKSPASPAVYAIGRGGTLHWVTSADVLVVVYGDAWETMVRTISDRDLRSRRFGEEIGTAAEYHRYAFADAYAGGSRGYTTGSSGYKAGTK